MGRNELSLFGWFINLCEDILCWLTFLCESQSEVKLILLGKLG